MKRLVFIFLVLPFLLFSLICYAIIAVAIHEYGKIDYADVVIFIVAGLSLVSFFFMNKLKNKLL